MKIAQALLQIALRSLLFRRHAVLLTWISVALSLFVVFAVDHVRRAAEGGFRNTVSGVDLIVGARTSDIHLLLHSIFRIGHASALMSWQSYEKLRAHPDVAWTLPLALGDSHRGFAVVGTEAEYFQHYRFARQRALSFAAGGAFSAPHDAVLGSQVARRLGYRVGESLVISHGSVSVAFAAHEQHPFRVVGVLQATGTPVDNAVYVPLAGLEAIHEPVKAPAERMVSDPGHEHEHEHEHEQELHQHSAGLSAVLIGLRAKHNTFRVQRWINSDTGESLLAILPGVALSELWQVVGVLESVLWALASLALLAALAGMAAMLMATMRERRVELRLLRVVGASPSHMAVLIVAEVLLIVITGALFALVLLWCIARLLGDALASAYGMSLGVSLASPQAVILLAAVILVAVLMSVLPVWSAYRSFDIKT